VLYQLLTARLPWEGTTLAELAMRRESESPLPPTTYDPDVPETLSQAVLRALDGDPAQRYTGARELSAALRAGLAGRTPPAPTGEATTAALAEATAPTRLLDERSRQAAPPPVEAPRRRPALAPATARPARPPRRRSSGGRLLRVLGLVLLVLVLAGIIATAVLLLTNAGQSTDISQFIKQNVPDQVKSLFDFIHAHTQ
jgi:eukaryotic-like serine/threonine-protein kinase